MINSNSEWVNVFNKLQMSVFAKNYFGHLVFVKMENNKIYLEGDIENNKIPENVKAEFEKVCSEFLQKTSKLICHTQQKKAGHYLLKNKKILLNRMQLRRI